MRMKIMKYIFFTIIIILIILAIYILYNNKQLIQTDIQEKNADNVWTKNITIGIVNFDNLNPHLSQNQDVQYLSKLIFKDLIGLTKDFKLEPSLAEEWSKIGDKVYIVKLKEDLVWSNKEKFTTEDVEFTINQLKQENSSSIYKDNVKNIEKVEKIDNLTMKIYLYEEEEFFEYNLCLPILCSKVNNNQGIVGIGEYDVININEKYILLQEKNNKETPKKIKVVLYNNYSDLYSDFSKKTLDVITTYNIEFNKYVGNIGIEQNKIIGREIVYILLNKENKKLKNKDLREIIKNSINKDEIIYNVYENQYVKADFVLNYGSYLEYREDEIKNVSKNYNLNLNFDIKDKEQKNIAEEIKRQLAQTGITVSIIENSEELYNKKIENKDYEMIVCKDTLGISPTIKKYINIENKEINELFKNIKNITDPEIIKEEYSKILEINEQEKNIIYLAFNTIIILHNSNVKGDFTGNWYNIFYNIDTWYKEM